MADGRVIQFKNELFTIDAQGQVRGVFARKKQGYARFFKVGGEHYFIDSERRIWQFYEDAVTALGAQGEGKLDMPEGVTAQPGQHDDRSGLWCRLTQVADREVMLDYITNFTAAK